jgi:hypothetical protein
MSGDPAVVKAQGLDNSYQLAPRAKIFRRDAGAIETLADVQTFMRSNHYGSSDPLAPTPVDAIAARGDLGPRGFAFGAIDAKITSASMMKNGMAVVAINGPTTSDGLPPFTWSVGSFLLLIFAHTLYFVVNRTGNYAKVSHVGIPQTVNFSWVNV